MFTGIVEELGRVLALELGPDSARLTVHGPLVTQDATVGSSIAVNGVCLTVTNVIDTELIDTHLIDTHVMDTGVASGAFVADVMAETLARSSLGELEPGSAVNLERPVAPSGRLGGHIVQGHVDGVGVVLDRTVTDRWELVEVGCPTPLIRYLVEKGSVAVDGVSLTVVSVNDPDNPDDRDHETASFTVSLIPQTLTDTTLGRRAVGQRVNIEVDVLAKYVERLLPTAGVATTNHAATSATATIGSR